MISIHVNHYPFIKQYTDEYMDGVQSDSYKNYVGLVVHHMINEGAKRGDINEEYSS